MPDFVVPQAYATTPGQQSTSIETSFFVSSAHRILAKNLSGQTEIHNISDEAYQANRAQSLLTLKDALKGDRSAQAIYLAHRFLHFASSPGWIRDKVVRSIKLTVTELGNEMSRLAEKYREDKFLDIALCLPKFQPNSQFADGLNLNCLDNYSTALEYLRLAKERRTPRSIPIAVTPEQLKVSECLFIPTTSNIIGIYACLALERSLSLMLRANILQDVSEIRQIDLDFRTRDYILADMQRPFEVENLNVFQAAAKQAQHEAQLREDHYLAATNGSSNEATNSKSETKSIPPFEWQIRSKFNLLVNDIGTALKTHAPKIKKPNHLAKKM